MDRIAEAAELALKNSDFGPEVKDHLQKVIDRNRELKAELAEANGLLDEVKKWKDQIHRVENDPIKAIEFVIDQFGVLDSILAKRKGGRVMGELYWCGYAIHFIGGLRCAFHLGTIVNGWAVSTVGYYMPIGKDLPQPIGPNDDDFFETAVAPCSGLDENLNPILGDWEIIKRFADSRDAEKFHHAEVAKRKGGE